MAGPESKRNVAETTRFPRAQTKKLQQSSFFQIANSKSVPPGILRQNPAFITVWLQVRACRAHQPGTRIQIQKNPSALLEQLTKMLFVS